MLNKAQMNCRTEEHGLITNVKGLNAYFYWKETGIPFGEWLDPVCEWVFFSWNWFVLILSDPCLTLIRLCFSFPYRFCSWFPRSVSIPSMLSSLLKLSDTSLTAFSFGIFEYSNWIWQIWWMPKAAWSDVAFQKKLASIKLLAHVITLIS